MPTCSVFHATKTLPAASIASLSRTYLTELPVADSVMPLLPCTLSSKSLGLSETNYPGCDLGLPSQLFPPLLVVNCDFDLTFAGPNNKSLIISHS
jgi:hypothetical protein